MGLVFLPAVLCSGFSAFRSQALRLALPEAWLPGLATGTQRGHPWLSGVIANTSFPSILLDDRLVQVEGFSIDCASFVPVPVPLPVMGASLAYGWTSRVRQRSL